jgi:hypothetical protein
VVVQDLHPRRLAFAAVKRMLLPPPGGPESAAGSSASLPSTVSFSMSRSRDRILANLDDMYGEAFEAAKLAADEAQQRSLDFAYRREQLYFEILLDIRDAMMSRK